MLFIFGIVTYLCFMLSIILFISAVLASSGANDINGRLHVNSLLVSSIICMGIYFIGSVGVILMAIIKSIRKETNGEIQIRRIGTEPRIQEIVTGSPGF